MDYETQREQLDDERTAMLKRWAEHDAEDALIVRRLSIATVIGIAMFGLMWLSVALARQIAPVVAAIALTFAFAVSVAAWAWAIKATR